MPKRTNLFQEVVSLLQTILAADASVEESAELIDLQTGAKREVDVCIFSEIAGHAVTISIECRDHARAQDVTWVEQELSKHSRLQTSLLVLVSRSGFTKEAYELAKRASVKLVVPGPLPESFAAEVQELLSTLWVKTLTVRPTKMVVTVDATQAWPEERISLDADHAFFNHEGIDVAHALQLVQDLTKEVMASEFEGTMRDATGEEKFATFGFERPEPNSEIDLFVKRDDVDPPVLRRVRRIDVTADAQVEVIPMDMRLGELDGAPYAYGSATSTTHEFLAVTTNMEQHNPAPQGTFAARVKPLGAPKVSQVQADPNRDA